MSGLSLMDYVKMQNEIYMSGLDEEPSTEVNVYGDDKVKQILRVWFDEEDQSIIDRCKGRLFIKAYSDHMGRNGVNIQTGSEIDFSELGYGPNSTAALRRIIALTVNGWTLQYLQDKGMDVYCKDDNHLNLRRENLVIGRIIHNWGEERREEYSLPQARYQLEKESTNDEETKVS